MRLIPRSIAVAVVFQLALVATSMAQTDQLPLPVAVPAGSDTVRFVPHPVNIKWWQIGIGVAAAGLTFETLDGPVRRFTQDHRSTTSDNVASVFRVVGEPPVYLGVGGAVLLGGLVTGKDEITRSGARLLSSVVLAEALGEGMKISFGRERPFVSGDDRAFHPFGGGDPSLPSGHSVGAFALATALSHELHSTPATIGLYVIATGTAWSRLNDDQHWLTDVLVGGAIGVVSAQFIYGKWTIFGIQPPRILFGPRGAGLGWSGTF